MPRDLSRRTLVKTRTEIVAAVACLFPLLADAAEYVTESYRTVGDRELSMHIVSPDGHSESARAVAVVYFHGGGWRQGSPESGFPYAETLAEHGIVTLAVEYRLVDSVTLDETIRDASEAIRWTRERARRLGVHSGRIIALGHSAGGHLAASTATLTGFDEADAYTRASARPNALALMAPYAATEESAGDYIPPRANIVEYEPRLNISRRMPPTLIIQGDADTTVVPAESSAYHDALVAAGVDSTLFEMDGVGHRFQENGARAAVSERLVQFARDIGFLE